MMRTINFVFADEIINRENGLDISIFLNDKLEKFSNFYGFFQFKEKTLFLEINEPFNYKWT